MNKLNAILFDLDGTLLDTAPDFAAVVNSLLQEQNQPELPYKDIRNRVSNGARGLVDLAFNSKPGDENFTYLHQRLLNLYEAHLTINTRLFPGISQLLETINKHNLAWGIVTNKPYRFTSPILKGFNLYTRANVIICPDHVEKTKPHPEPLLLACDKLNCKPHESIYIGDHRRDIEAGNSAGMKTMAALYGYIDATENPAQWNADFQVNEASEIHDWLLQNIT